MLEIMDETAPLQIDTRTSHNTELRQKVERSLLEWLSGLEIKNRNNLLHCLLSIRDLTISVQVRVGCLDITLLVLMGP